jgi:hypothetical protein
LTLSVANAADKESPPDVSTLMTPEDFTESGLDKLSDAERAHLSAWVERYREGAVIGPVVHKKPSEMTEEEKVEAKQEEEILRPSEIVAKVVPSFKGWTGKTIFRLDNGQLWQQRQNGKLLYDGNDSNVTITKNALGKYVLRHEDTGRGIGVKRIN